MCHTFQNTIDMRRAGKIKKKLALESKSVDVEIQRWT